MKVAHETGRIDSEASFGGRREIATIPPGLATEIAGLTPLKQARSSRRRVGWRTLRGSAKGTDALKEDLAEHRREAKR
jgi:hypothetical protein